ncbi:MAG: hypothetical protein HFJ05_07635 [Eubacterium sp.]|nr:hypothetical protein [Eubacterium sp.]
MKKCNLLKKYGTLFLLLCMLGTSIYYSMPVMTVSASEIQPLSDDIRWVFKIENGKKYKRLYNYTTQTWVGNWILVG